jgi:NADH:ubiquinone oxidoreductase subunit E
MKGQRKISRLLIGHFLGWGDDRIPHRYLKLSTPNGEQLIKVAKSLRPHIQDWQPGIWLTLIGSERMDRSTGETQIKVKQLLTAPQADSSQLAGSESAAIEPTKIQVCQGSSCRRRGSEQICRSMQVYLAQHDLTDRVEIETVKCLHQCKAAPQAIVTSPAANILPGKTHYRQLQPRQVPALLAKHFPIATPAKQIGTNLIEKIGNYLDRQLISTSHPLS